MENNTLQIGKQVKAEWNYQNQTYHSDNAVIVNLSPVSIMLLDPVEENGKRYKAGRKIILTDQDSIKME